MRKRRILVGLVGALLVAGTVYLLSPPPEPEPYRETISRGEYIQTFIEEDNAFHDYLSAARLYKEVPDDISEEFDCYRIGAKEINKVSNGLRAYVRENEPAIDMIREATTKKNCIVPKVTTLNDLLPYLSRFRALARVMVAGGKIKEIDRNYEGAYRDYLDTMRFGRDISNGGTVIHGLISISICSPAMNSMQSGLKRADAKTLGMVVEGLKEIEDNFVPCSEILRNEHDMSLKGMEYSMRSRGNLRPLISPHKFHDGGGLAHYIGSIDESNLKYNARWVWIWLTKNRIRRNMRNITQKMVECADKPIYESEEEEFKKETPRNIMSTTFLHKLSRVKTQYAVNYANLRGTRLRAAIELYQRRHDEFPHDLNLLVSAGIIDQVLMDPFTNDPFKYVDGRIYCIGKDFKDDKGLVEYGPKKENHYSQEGDLVF